MLRRELLKALPAGLALVGSGLLPWRAGAESPPLRVLGWRGYEDSVFYGAYARAHGLPEFMARAAGDEALAALRAGQRADVAEPCLYELGSWIDAGVILPLDTARLANWPDLWRPLRVLASGPEEGSVWCVPFDWGAGSVIYRTDLAGELPASWWVLYDERHSGRVAVQRTVEAVVGCASLALGIARPWAADEEERRAIADLIGRQRSVATYWSDPAEAERGLESGDLVAAYGWNDMYARLRSRNVPVAFMAPQEGCLLWVCGLARTASGEADTEGVHAFVDAMLAPASGAALIARYGYGHANRLAFDLVPPRVLTALALESPATLLGRGLVLDGATPDERENLRQLYESAVSES